VISAPQRGTSRQDFSPYERGNELVSSTAESPAARAPHTKRTNMNRTALQWLGHSLAVVAAAALLTGCAGDAPLGPDRQPAFPAQRAATPAAAQVGAVATGADAGNKKRAADVGGCENLQVPAGSKLAFHVYAEGVQIYRWNGTSWSFVGPSALLSADAGGKGTVGIHYSGPTWESVSGSTVAGTVLQRCTPDPNAIPWLLLGAVSTEGPGVFQRTAFIQRVNTVGGNAPPDPGSFTGEVASVPYTAEYLFYRAP